MTWTPSVEPRTVGIGPVTVEEVEQQLGIRALAAPGLSRGEFNVAVPLEYRESGAQPTPTLRATLGRLHGARFGQQVEEAMSNEMQRRDQLRSLLDA